MTTGSKRVLALYYSLTHQTHRVLSVINDALEQAGHTVDRRRITPVEEWSLPLPRKVFVYDFARMFAGVEYTQPLQPMDLNPDDYDCILLGFQPWFLAPSIPVNSFLESPMASVFQGKKVVAVVTCRGRWEEAYRIVRDKVASRGGTLMDGFVVRSPDRYFKSLATTFYYLRTGHGPPPGHPFSSYHPFEIDGDALDIARGYGEDLATRLLEDRMHEQAGWRVVNEPLPPIRLSPEAGFAQILSSRIASIVKIRPK